MTDSPVIFELRGGIVPKARARVTRRGTFMPKNYVTWKDSAIAELRLQSSHLRDRLPLEGVGIDITLSGKHSRRGDLDNISGAVLDALVQAQVLRNDNLVCVLALAVRLHYGKAEPITQITIDPIDE
jgi:Holliday junction resolvase RusA-like endonuclease